MRSWLPHQNKRLCHIDHISDSWCSLKIPLYLSMVYDPCYKSCTNLSQKDRTWLFSLNFSALPYQATRLLLNKMCTIFGRSLNTIATILAIYILPVPVVPSADSNSFEWARAAAERASEQASELCFDSPKRESLSSLFAAFSFWFSIDTRNIS